MPFKGLKPVVICIGVHRAQSACLCNEHYAALEGPASWPVEHRLASVPYLPFQLLDGPRLLLDRA